MSEVQLGGLLFWQGTVNKVSQSSLAMMNSGTNGSAPKLSPLEPGSQAGRQAGRQDVKGSEQQINTERFTNIEERGTTMYNDFSMQKSTQIKLKRKKVKKDTR